MTTQVEPAELTDRQREIFEAIYASARDLGYQPSHHELKDRFGISSPNGLKCHLDAIRHKGWIDIRSGESRSLRFLRRPDGTEFTGFAEKGDL